MSIRLRLTLWHAAVFFVSLAGFALVVWIGTRQVIRRDIDTWLVRQADGLCEFLRKETHGTGQAAVVEETREFSTGLPAGSGVQLFDPHSNVIYALPKMNLSGLSEQPSTLISGAVPVRAVVRTVTIADETFQVALWRSMIESETALKDLRDVLLLMVPAFLVISAAGGWFLSRRAFRPVDEITDAARQISLQNLSMTLPVPPHADELQRLTNAWNEMLRRLDASTRQLRQFTADVSHELRTPVTVIRTTAELALRQERPPDQYRAALQAICDDSQDLSSVIENLLELARADSGPVLSLQPVDFRAVVSEITSQVESMAGELDVQFTLPPDPVFVMGDRAALRRLVLLLIDNAIKFTPVPGRVAVRVYATAHEAIFEVEDSGIGISSEDLLRVFDRFYQVDHSRSGGGVGLGLSIGSWIVEEHSGRIEARSDLHHGSLFRVTLPAAGPPVKLT